MSLVIWRPIRRKTIDLLEQHKDEVSKIVRDMRIAKIAGSATSLVVGGSLAIAGLVGGVALAVTAPLDIYQIGRNSYDLATSGQHGENESDETFVWYTEQIKKLKEELDHISSHQEDKSTQDD